MSTNSTDTMKCVIIGSDISPEKLSAKELAEFITALEKTLVSTANKHSKVRDKEFIVSIVGINSGSVNLEFKGNYAEEINGAIKVIGDAISKQDFDWLTKDSVDGLKTMFHFLEKHDCKAKFCYSSEGEATAFLDPIIELPDPKHYQISGETTLYGQLIRIGGVKPRATLRVADGEDVFCDVSAEQVYKLANKLYHRLSLTGMASWDADTYKILSFKVSNFEELEDIPIDQAIKDLSKIIGKYYEDIDDPVAYIQNLRSDEW